MIRFEDILEKVEKYYKGDDLDLLRRAYLFSAMVHKGQVRKSGEPYLVHPMEVANILAEMRLDIGCIATGFLHDVVEDTYATVEEIDQRFGKDIAHLVDGLTKISQIGYASREESQAETVRKMLLAMVDDILSSPTVCTICARWNFFRRKNGNANQKRHSISMLRSRIDWEWVRSAANWKISLSNISTPKTIAISRR
jgi:(p)ppGpp synthase/HD superfamily hydrolase